MAGHSAVLDEPSLGPGGFSCRMFRPTTSITCLPEWPIPRRIGKSARGRSVPLSGFPAFAVTRGYHLLAMPGNRIRVAADWLLNALLPQHNVQLGLVRSG